MYRDAFEGKAHYVLLLGVYFYVLMRFIHNLEFLM